MDLQEKTVTADSGGTDSGGKTQAVTAAALSARANPMSIRQRIASGLDRVVFICFCLIAILAPHNIHWAFQAFQAASLVWILKLPVAARKFQPQPLLAPALLFMALATIATSLSYAPALSWDRLKWFALLFLAVLVTQNLSSLKQTKILIFLLLASAMFSVARTGWQYAHGIGTELVTVSPDTNLFQRGLRSGDIVQAINGHATRTPAQWSEALRATRTDKTLTLRIARNAPLEVYPSMQIENADLQQWLNQPGAMVKRGRPPRAQGHFYHYIPYAGMLLQLGLLVFGLLLSGWKEHKAMRWMLAAAFLGLTAALVATVTRTYMATLLLGCVFLLWLAHKKIRTLAWVALALGFIVATLWIQKERKMGWMALGDAGSEYRWLMWKDAPRLIARHPVFGVGPDSVLVYGEQWNLAAYKKFPLRSHFHSTFIELAVDCGLPCLAAWVWLMTAYLSFLAHGWKRAQNWPWFPRGAFLGIFGGAIAFMMSSVIHYAQGDAEVMILIWFFAGIAIVLMRILGSGTQAPTRT